MFFKKKNKMENVREEINTDTGYTLRTDIKTRTYKIYFTDLYKDFKDEYIYVVKNIWRIYNKPQIRYTKGVLETTRTTIVKEFEVKDRYYGQKVEVGPNGLIIIYDYKDSDENIKDNDADKIIIPPNAYYKIIESVTVECIEEKH